MPEREPRTAPLHSLYHPHFAHGLRKSLRLWKYVVKVELLDLLYDVIRAWPVRPFSAKTGNINIKRKQTTIQPTI